MQHANKIDLNRALELLTSLHRLMADAYANLHIADVIKTEIQDLLIKRHSALFIDFFQYDCAVINMAQETLAPIGNDLLDVIFALRLGSGADHSQISEAKYFYRGPGLSSFGLTYPKPIGSIGELQQIVPTECRNNLDHCDTNAPIAEPSLSICKYNDPVYDLHRTLELLAAIRRALADAYAALHVAESIKIDLIDFVMEHHTAIFDDTFSFSCADIFTAHELIAPCDDRLLMVIATLRAGPDVGEFRFKSGL